MSLIIQQAKFLRDVCKLLEFADAQGFVVTAGEAFRTAEQQAIYVKTGRSKTMASNHMRRCAMDFNFFRNGKLTWDKATLQPLGDFWETLDTQNAWGGNWSSFKDVPHFERKP